MQAPGRPTTATGGTPLRIQARKSVSAGAARRDQRQSERIRSPAMASLYPQIKKLRIEFSFQDNSPFGLSPQAHTLFPAAQAFFRFACPCAECDGEFDLSKVVEGLQKRQATGNRATAQAADQYPCEGVRRRDQANSTPCTLTLKYRLLADFETDAERTTAA
jgi:hypothetical protein